jgi:hypothetical protein
VASVAQSPIDFDDVMLAEGNAHQRGYGQSKLAQIFLARDLAEELEGTGVLSVSLHPATLMGTGMVLERGIEPRATVEEGLEAVLHLVHTPTFRTASTSGASSPWIRTRRRWTSEARERLRTLSRGAHRRTLISSVQMADLDVGWISQIGPLGSGQAIVYGTGSAGVRVIDLDRMLALERLPLERSVQPPPGFRGDLVIATDQADGRWAVAMRFGPDWWIRGPDGRPVRREMIHRPAHALRGGSRTVSEDVRIAGPVDPSRHGAYSLSLHEDGFSILTGGGWGGVSEPNDIIDLYDHNGRYCGSLRIPFDAMDHVWQGDVLVALRTSPHPSLVAVRTHRSPCVAG